MKRYLVILAGVLLLLFLDTQRAAACSCMPPATANDALLQADAVFSGRVQAFIPVQQFGEDVGGLVIFRVGQSWKGNVSTTTLVNSGYNRMSCEGYFWQQGEEYLVYAHQRANGTLGVHLCSRTTELRNAQQDIQELGAGAAPRAASMLWMCVGILVCVVLISSGSLWFIRCRRHMSS